MNNKEYIIEAIKELSEKELQSLIDNSEYEYVFFDVSVFNAGAIIKPELTNDLDDSKLEDGYSFYLCANEAAEYAKNIITDKKVSTVNII